VGAPPPALETLTQRAFGGSGLCSTMAPAARGYSLFSGHTQQAALCRSMLRSGSHEVGTPALELSLQNNSIIDISFDCYGSPRRATTYMDGLGRRLTSLCRCSRPRVAALGQQLGTSTTCTCTCTCASISPPSRSRSRSHTATTLLQSSLLPDVTASPTNRRTKRNETRNERRASRRTRRRCRCRNGRGATRFTTTTTTPSPSSQPPSFHLARSSCPAALCLRVSLRVAPFRALRCPPASSDPCLPGTACPAHNTTLTLPSTIPLPFGKILTILPGSSLPARQPACRALPGTSLPTGRIGPLLARDGLSTTPHNPHNPPSLSLPPPHHLLTTWVCAAASATCDASACLPACLEPP